MPTGPIRQQLLPDANEDSMEGFLTMVSGSRMICIASECHGLSQSAGAMWSDVLNTPVVHLGAIHSVCLAIDELRLSDHLMSALRVYSWDNSLSKYGSNACVCVCVCVRVCVCVCV